MDEKILVVEDEQALRETLVYNLERQKYTVIACADGESAVKIAREEKPDLLILDLMLPKLDGFEICRILRPEMNAPILMLTARDDEIDKVLGLELGADDYITKPFSMRELLARVKAQLRRVRLIRQETAGDEATPHETIQLGDLNLDLARREVQKDGKNLTLKPKEFELLVYFARHKGRLVSRDQILEQVWGWDFSGESRTVDVHVSWLREKIEKNPAKPERIVTVRGAGYRFEG